MELNIKIKNMKKTINNKKAFVSIFAIFFSTIIVSILLSLYILLIKQIENMNLDSASFQAFYVADSGLDCAIYKERFATGTNSFFAPNNYSAFGYCGDAGDFAWQKNPEDVNGKANSTFLYKINTQQGEFCSVVNVERQLGDAEISNKISVNGQSRGCGSADTKIVERGIDFFY
jgi:hypothetical protein